MVEGWTEGDLFVAQSETSSELLDGRFRHLVPPAGWTALESSVSNAIIGLCAFVLLSVVLLYERYNLKGSFHTKHRYQS